MKTVALAELASAPTTEGGLRISYSGNSTDLLIGGGLEDQTVGYSAIMPFALNPLPSGNANPIAEIGLMNGPADPMMRFPAGITFTPYTVVRNTSTAPLRTTLTVWWMAGGAPHSFQLPAITLAAYQTRTLDLVAPLAAAGLRNSSQSINLVFDVQGDSSALLMAGGSVDQNNTYVFEVSPRWIMKSASKSLAYWNTANGDDTMVTLWNPADEAQDFVFTLFFVGGHYHLPIHLDPRATRTFNISEIVNSQIPDERKCRSRRH